VRLLHVIQELRTGGAERVVLSLAHGAEAAGHRVAVASAPGELLPELAGDHFPLPLIERKPWRVPGATSKLAQAVRAWRPDLVHCHNPAMAVVVSLVTLRGRRSRALVSVHGVPESDWAAAAHVLRLAGLPIVACGPGIQDALAEHGAHAVATICNGVSPPPRAADRAKLEREWSLPPGSALVVSVGRLVAAKNHRLAIRALRSIPEATLAIVGDGPLRRDLEETAEKEGVAGRVVLTGLHSDARALIGAADVVVMCSRAEGLPMVVLETLVAGRPLVATAVRGLRELLTDGRDALLVPDDDSDGLAEAIRRVLDDRALGEELGASGRELATRFSEDVMVADYLALYSRMLR
jgi:glycosyltransferase involved in cell wall biosynthesis